MSSWCPVIGYGSYNKVVISYRLVNFLRENSALLEFTKEVKSNNHPYIWGHARFDRIAGAFDYMNTNKGSMYWSELSDQFEDILTRSKVYV